MNTASTRQTTIIRSGNSFRAATVTVDYDQAAAASPDRRDALIMAQVEQGLAMEPDLLLLPELCWCYGAEAQMWEAVAESRDSTRVRHFSQLARQHECYIGLPILERREDRLFNTLLLLDRQGKVAWHYDKIFLTEGELEIGISPGTKPRPFETDFGRIGAAICFDLNFMELMEFWRKEEVDHLLFSSIYRGGRTLSAWAMEAQCFIIAATADEGSQIVDPLGQSLGRSSRFNPVLLRELPKDYEVFHIDRNATAWPELWKNHGSRIHLEIASEEARFYLASRDPQLKTVDLIKRHQLLPLREYLEPNKSVKPLSGQNS